MLYPVSNSGHSINSSFVLNRFANKTILLCKAQFSTL